ncbi:ribosome assembly RNA-binding protein YhbY [Miniphocaeibacter massiliensis]|uniref:ribosome assembly RNA-binding protein YhbY n=1 Tax=Miniphocaeibacter massiliensis TaxID=2041841 RepID=UPI000C1BF85D|nr:ribosome assembly RNA-binding protein YhbY [Miniphocaeibacter massiliensis]
MINPKQRAYLKGLAHDMEPLLLIGKGGISENTLKQLDDLLKKRELIKVKILNNNLDDKNEIVETILDNLNAEFVQIIGSKFVVYRESKEKKIELPK